MSVSYPPFDELYSVLRVILPFRARTWLQNIQTCKRSKVMHSRGMVNYLNKDSTTLFSFYLNFQEMGVEDSCIVGGGPRNVDSRLAIFYFWTLQGGIQ